jgi:hypothetical protein
MNRLLTVSEMEAEIDKVIAEECIGLSAEDTKAVRDRLLVFVFGAALDAIACDIIGLKPTITYTNS